MIYELTPFSVFKENCFLHVKTDDYECCREYERYLQSFLCKYAEVLEREYQTITDYVEKLYLNRVFQSVCESLKWCENRDFETLEYYLLILTKAASVLDNAREILRFQLSEKSFIYFDKKVEVICAEIFQINAKMESEINHLRDAEQNY